MSSNYDYPPLPEEVREEASREVRCNACHGSGLVEVQGQETDCIECEGFGSILI